MWRLIMRNCLSTPSQASLADVAVTMARDMWIDLYLHTNKEDLFIGKKQKWETNSSAI